MFSGVVKRLVAFYTSKMTDVQEQKMDEEEVYECKMQSTECNTKEINNERNDNSNVKDLINKFEILSKQNLSISKTKIKSDLAKNKETFMKNISDKKLNNRSAEMKLNLFVLRNQLIEVLKGKESEHCIKVSDLKEKFNVECSNDIDISTIKFLIKLSL